MKTEGYRIKEYRQPVKRYCQTLDLNGDSELIAKYREATAPTARQSMPMAA